MGTKQGGTAAAGAAAGAVAAASSAASATSSAASATSSAACICCLVLKERFNCSWMVCWLKAINTNSFQGYF